MPLFLLCAAFQPMQSFRLYSDSSVYYFIEIKSSGVLAYQIIDKHFIPVLICSVEEGEPI